MVDRAILANSTLAVDPLSERRNRHAPVGRCRIQYMEQNVVTFAEYVKLPDPEERLVLHRGHVVSRPIHTLPECKLKNHICRVIDEAIHHQGFVTLSLAYQPLPDFELWVAGVGVLSLGRIKATPEDGYLFGAPEVVIEVKGPSISADEIQDERELALTTGCHQFWVVDPGDGTVHVTNANQTVTVYKADVSISLPAPWTDVAVSVSSIFAK